MNRCLVVLGHILAYILVYGVIIMWTYIILKFLYDLLRV